MKRLPILALALFMTSCGDTYHQNSPAMEPTIKQGDIVDADMKAYDNADPERWDVAVFESPTGEGKWMSRVVGLPGEIVNIDSLGVTINGTRMAPPDTAIHYKLDAITKTTFPYQVPKSAYFMLSDNTSDAIDSRHYGALDRSRILGKILGVNTNPIMRKVYEESK